MRALAVVVALFSSAGAQPAFELAKVTYKSDGLDVVAFVYAPAKSTAKLPVIVYNRGSYIRNNTTKDLMPMYERLGAAGFIVVAPMYRGSEGAPGRDEMGGADLADLMNVRSVIAELPFADTTNVFMYGESRGGMMTFQAMRDGFPVRAAATIGAFTDLETYFKDDPKAEALSTQIWPEFQANRDAIFERRSVLRWVERIDVPLLIMHGGDDTAVKPDHSQRLAAALQQRGKRFELAILPGAKHTGAPFEADRDRRAVDWFRQHLTQ